MQGLVVWRQLSVVPPGDRTGAASAGDRLGDRDGTSTATGEDAATAADGRGLKW